MNPIRTFVQQSPWDVIVMFKTLVLGALYNRSDDQIEYQVRDRLSLMRSSRLMALPPAFDGFIEHSKRVSPTCLITFERNRYSVPASFANRRVSLHVYPERLIVVAEGQTVCKHARTIERSRRKPGKVSYDWRHYLAAIQRKPDALRNGAPFTEMPDAFRQLQDHMLRKDGGDREMVGILSLVLQHNEADVLCTVELALEAGVSTKTHILNILNRLIDRRPTDHPEVDPPDALALQTTPVANVGRYDGLRRLRRSAMRHDPAGASIVIMLRNLKLYGMANVYRPSESLLMLQGVKCSHE